MSLKKTLLAATVLSLPLAAQAQPVTGIYVGAGGGYNYRSFAQDTGIRVKPEQYGEVGVASIGYGFGNGFRAEIEGNFRHNDVRRTQISTVGTGVFRGTSGALRTYGGMVNGLYDFSLASFGLPQITPYVGVGVGYGHNNWDRVTARSANGAGLLRSRGSEGNLAYQGIVGMAFGLGSVVPGLALTAEYRYYGVVDTQQRFTASGVVGPAAGRIEPSNGNHSGLIGLRYNFGVAPAPILAQVPVAPVAPSVARTFLVFFDWNRADLTPRAREIIGEAAQSSRTANVTRLEVSGHADRSGTPAYNQRLSQRRAEAVAADLVSKGVSRAAITIQAFGESRPLVPTADNVREPQNRRVEIVLR